MEVKPGYKQSEVGVIPHAWSVTSLGELAELTSSKRIFESDYVPSGIPFYRGKEISLLIDGKAVDDPYFITEKKFHDIKTQFGAPEQGDILVTAVGTLANVFVVGNEAPFYFKDGNLIWLRKMRTADPYYVGIQLRTRKSDIINGAIGTSQKALTIVVLRDFRIPYPPLPEQRAIATTLSDVDALLGALDRLTAKKRDLKQAAMQQLLTGQTRLPGFHGEWQEGIVEDVILSYFCGPSPTCEERNITDDSEWGVLKTTAVTKEAGWNWKAHKLLPRVFWNKPNLEVRKGDVVVTKAGPRHRVGVTAWVDFVPPRIIVSGKMIGLRANPAKIVPLMLASAISGPEAQVFLDQRTTGMAESQVNFENSALLQTPIRFPKIDEQTAIADVLTDMDAEIAVLERRREKTRALKQAMMRELLTGKIRLVVPEETHA